MFRGWFHDDVRIDYRMIKWWHVVVPSMRRKAKRVRKPPGKRKLK